MGDPYSEAEENLRRSFLSLGQLLAKVAAHKGLKMRDGGSSHLYTESFATIKLTGGLIAFLATRGIERRPHSEGMFTLADTNPQKHVEGWASSNYWNQKTNGDIPPQIELYVGLGLNKEERGVQFWPHAAGNFLSPCDHLPNFRMFKAVVDNNPQGMPEIAKEIAASNGHIVVSWTDINLGGIRDAPSLFLEFAGNNKELFWLARQNKVFDPNPTVTLFIPEPSQPAVFKNWREQLERYRSALAA